MSNQNQTSLVILVAAIALTAALSLGFSGRVASTNHSIVDIALGKVAGQGTVNKFGRNINIGNGVTADVWDGGQTGDVSLIWVPPTQARIHAIVSTSLEDSDTGGVNPQGDGARTLRVYGLVDWDTKEVNEDIIMDGTTAVNTSNSYVIIHRLETLTKGSHATGPNVGTITATAATDSTVTAKIRPSQGQTQMAILGIPSVQTFMVLMIRNSANKAVGTTGSADIHLLVNPEPDAELLNYLTKDTEGIKMAGDSSVPMPYVAPKVIPGPAVIKLQASSDVVNMDISSSFDGILVDN